MSEAYRSSAIWCSGPCGGRRFAVRGGLCPECERAPIKMTTSALRELAEYSCTLPTGTIIGKKWRRHEPYQRDLKKCGDNAKVACDHWILGEYIDIGSCESVGIRWKKIEVVS